VSQGLDRVRNSARQRKKEQFTALLHHVSVDLLRDASLAPKRRAAPGADGVTWDAYAADLESHLQDLHRREHTGAYRAQPVGRRFIPKSDGGQHDALDALCFGIERKRVNWILDADILRLFARVDQQWLVRFLEHRVGDERVVRLVRQWLEAGTHDGRPWDEQATAPALPAEVVQATAERYAQAARVLLGIQEAASTGSVEPVERHRP
jgi:RNA-directed DNA polymerase